MKPLVNLQRPIWTRVVGLQFAALANRINTSATRSSVGRTNNSLDLGKRKLNAKPNPKAYEFQNPHQESLGLAHRAKLVASPGINPCSYQTPDKPRPFRGLTRLQSKVVLVGKILDSVWCKGCESI